MEQKIVKISELKKPEKNVRIHNENQLKQFEKSVEMFGQIRPIVIDENNVILAGNGLYETLVRMGKTDCEVYQYTGLTDHQKKKLMIADNKIFSLGIENMETLNSFLEDLGEDLEIPGYDEDVLRQMMADASETTQTLSDYGTVDEPTKHEIQQVQVVRPDPEQQAAAPQAEESREQEPAGASFVICPNCGEKIWL
jgi:ParB-like chromosome segregation protein Spo0J